MLPQLFRINPKVATWAWWAAKEKALTPHALGRTKVLARLTRPRLTSGLTFLRLKETHAHKAGCTGPLRSPWAHTILSLEGNVDLTLRRSFYWWWHYYTL